MLSLKVKLSIVVVPTNDVVPLTVRSAEAVKLPVTPKVDDKVVAPDTDAVPSTMSPSLILIVEESVALKLVPLIVIAPTIMFPVPAALIIKSEFDAVAFISLSVMLILSSIVRLAMTTDPVPPGVNCMSALELEEIISVSYTHLTLPTKRIV